MLVKHDQNYGMKALWAYVRSLGPLDKPSREWRGLTDDELWALWNEEYGVDLPDWFNDFKGAARVVEAKLKERNT